MTHHLGSILVRSMSRGKQPRIYRKRYFSIDWQGASDHRMRSRLGLGRAGGIAGRGNALTHRAASA